MRILVISQFFWPENFHINDIVEYLDKKDCEITILTTHPNYPNYKIYDYYWKDIDNYKYLNNCKIIRVPSVFIGKSNVRYILSYLSFLISASILGIWKTRKYKYDLIFIYQTSPATVIIPALLFKFFRNIPIICWVLDLWPDALNEIKNIKNRILVKLSHTIMKFIYSRCDLLLCQSKGMVEILKKRIKDQKIYYFPSYQADLHQTENNQLKSKVIFEKNYFNIVFTGNIGDAQDFLTVLDAATKLKDKKIKWYIVGDGNKFDWLKKQIKVRELSSNFYLLGHYNVKYMNYFYSNADALLVTLKPLNIYKITVPGKVQTYLKSGTPILASLDGDGAFIIKNAKAGLVNKPGQSQELVKNILQLKSMSLNEKIRMGENGRKYSNINFNKSIILKKLEKYIYEFRN